VLLVGLLVTGVLAWVSQSLYTSNEQRLLNLRVREAGSVLSAAVTGIQTPLASSAELADATNGDVQKFKRFITPYVGTARTQTFVAVSLWRLGGPLRTPVVSVGQPLALNAAGGAPAAFFARTARSRTLGVMGLLQPPDRRLGYAFITPGAISHFVAYGESRLPPDRRSRVANNSAFSDLDYVVYLGHSQRPQDLLVTSLSQLRVQGTHASQTVPFGNSALTLVMSPRRALAGALPQRLPWLIAIVGALLTAGAGALTLRLIQRRRDAEQLVARLDVAAEQNRLLYAQQRNIAQTLQHALLPDMLPELRGAEASARFEAGEHGVKIGGDWYDVIRLDDRRLLIVVGDVSGRGLRAASTMASLRYAIHAYAAQNDPPETILSKLSKLVSVDDGGHIATVLCALVDIDTREVTITSAGHLPPLLIGDGHSRYVHSDVGLPVGVDRRPRYRSITVTAPRAATLLLYTDGLVERRGESVDEGLARLQSAATAANVDLDELLSRLVSQVRAEPTDDDTAIVGLRWTT
jgi:serine phosphatase RsbU (regulator of sigma subunit)